MRAIFTIFILSLLTESLPAQAITFTSSCETTTICSSEDDCGPAFAELIAEATTTCPSGNLSYSYSIDLGNDGSIDQSGSLADASGDFPLGEHKITFTASDDCNNSENCEIIFTMKDCVAPEVSAFNGLAFDFDITQFFELYAIDFDNGSTDNCGVNNWLLHSPSLGPGQIEPPASASPSIIFDCDQLGTNTLDFWVGDAAGNWSYLSTYVLAQDNLNNCDSNGPSFELCLYAETECGLPIDGVGFQVEPNPPGIPDIFPCNTYPSGSVLTVTPYKNTHPLNGVSTFDLVMISRHILGMQILDSPYKILAADVNSSGSATALDMVIIRQLILGMITEFPNTTSWGFIHADYVFPDQQNPWATALPSICTINGFEEDITKTFIGFKKGDVNKSAIPNDSLVVDNAEDRSGRKISWNIEDQPFTAGQEIRIPFRSNDFKAIAGYQFELAYDSEALTFLGFEQGQLHDLDISNFNFKKGSIKTSWIEQKPQEADYTGQDLFYLNFKTKKAGKISDFLKTKEDNLNPEAYSYDLEILKLGLEFEQNNKPLDIRLFANEPNPFQASTSISFELPEDQIATLVIYDLNGRVIESIQKEAFKGLNRWIINAGEYAVPGVYFYQLKTRDGSITRKMIRQ